MNKGSTAWSHCSEAAPAWPCFTCPKQQVMTGNKLQSRQLTNFILALVIHFTPKPDWQCMDGTSWLEPNLLGSIFLPTSCTHFYLCWQSLSILQGDRKFAFESLQWSGSPVINFVTKVVNSDILKLIFWTWTEGESAPWGSHGHAERKSFWCCWLQVEAHSKTGRNRPEVHPGSILALALARE